MSEQMNLDESLLDMVESTDQFLVESISDVDDEHILARVVGESFFLDKPSRNKRFYPASLWHKIVSDESILKKFDDRMMFGTVGHNLPIDDEAIREGKVSHIVSKMWITDDGKGMAEFLILNTNAGRVLNTLLRAKARMYTSTRAKGSFLKKFDNKGNQYVNEDNFSFETIDFVYNPGFLESRPDLVEAFQQIDNAKGNNMSEQNTTIELLSEELRAQRSTSLQQNQEIGRLTAELKTLGESADAADSELKAYKDLGTVEEISACMDKLKKMESEGKSKDESLAVLSQYQALGDIALVTESVSFAKTVREANAGSLDNVVESLNAFKSLTATAGTSEEIVAHLENYLALAKAGISDVDSAKTLATLMSEEFGSIDEAQDAIAALRNFEAEAGSLEEALNALRISEQFIAQNSPANLIADSKALADFTEEFGDLADVRRALHLTNAYTKHLQAEALAVQTKQFAESLNAPVEKVQEWLDKGMDKDTITEMFTAAKAAQPAQPVKVQEENTNTNTNRRVNGALFLNENKAATDIQEAKGFKVGSRLDNLIG